MLPSCLIISELLQSQTSFANIELIIGKLFPKYPETDRSVPAGRLVHPLLPQWGNLNLHALNVINQIMYRFVDVFFRMIGVVGDRGTKYAAEDDRRHSFYIHIILEFPFVLGLLKVSHQHVFHAREPFVDLLGEMWALVFQFDQKRYKYAPSREIVSILQIVISEIFEKNFDVGDGRLIRAQAGQIAFTPYLYGLFKDMEEEIILGLEMIIESAFG
jgi:hypothetical protein